MVTRVAVLGVVVILLGCSEVPIESNWARKPPVVDGDLADWKNASLAVFDNLHVSVGVGNDSSFLYLGGRIANPSIERIVERSGVTIWLAAEGGKEKDLEIRFPASSAARADLARGGFAEEMTEAEKNLLRRQSEAMRNSVLVIDRRGVDSHLYKTGNIEGFEGVIVHSPGVTSFEARVPLRIGEFFPAFKSIAPETEVTIGVELGGRAGDTPRDFDQRGGESPGDFGTDRRSGRGSPRDSQFPEDREIWLEVRLARAR